MRGKVLYQQHKCASCHSIDGQGGETGPPLDGIGAHRGREWLVARLLDPKKQMEEFPEVFGGKPCLMPHPGVNTAAAKLLADYLLTIEEPKAGFRVSGHSRQVDDVSKSTIDGDETWQPQPESQAVQSGKEAFISLHCGACHSLDGSGGRFAPDLSGIRFRRNSKELEKILSGAVGSSIMKRQAQSLGDDQIYDLKAFLLTIPKAK
ncbi:MAG: cytochrome c [Cyanobacteria bacterium]|nr:cytochrome c [Cyanobacteriota bacterium]